MIHDNIALSLSASAVNTINLTIVANYQNQTFV